MPRFRLRLATFGLLIVIIALAVALVVQQRREMVLKTRIQALEAEIDLERRVFKVVRAGFDREREFYKERLAKKQKEIDELRSKIGRRPGEGKDAGRSQPAGDGRSVGAKR
jgi:hypothetical protein